MAMNKTEIVDMSNELVDILGRINGAINVEEQLALQYVVTLKTEEDKEGAEKVAQTLMDQANAHHISLEIMLATEAEIADAKKRLESLMEKGN